MDYHRYDDRPNTWDGHRHPGCAYANPNTPAPFSVPVHPSYSVREYFLPYEYLPREEFTSREHPPLRSQAPTPHASHRATAALYTPDRPSQHYVVDPAGASSRNPYSYRSSRNLPESRLTWYQSRESMPAVQPRQLRVPAGSRNGPTSPQAPITPAQRLAARASKWLDRAFSERHSRGHKKRRAAQASSTHKSVEQKYSFSEYITGQEYVSCRSTDDGFRDRLEHNPAGRLIVLDDQNVLRDEVGRRIFPMYGQSKQIAHPTLYLPSSEAIQGKHGAHAVSVWMRLLRKHHMRRLEQCQKVVEVVTDTDDRTVHDAVKGELPALIIAGIVRRVWSQRDGNALRLELTRYNPCQFSISQDVMPEPIA